MLKHGHKLSLAAAAAAFAIMAGSSGAMAGAANGIKLEMCIKDGLLNIWVTSDEALKKATVSRSGDALLKNKTKNAAKEDGFTEWHETVDPDTYPAGTYKVEAKTTDGDELSDTTSLDKCEPDPPVVEAVDGCAVEDFGKTGGDLGADCESGEGLPDGDVDPVDIDFADVNTCAMIDHYSVHFQCEGSPAVEVEVDPATDCAAGTCTASIPNAGDQYSDEDVECTVKVTAVDDTCNETTAELMYKTDDGS